MRAPTRLVEAVLTEMPIAEGDNPTAIAPAGLIHASLEEWSRFVQLHHTIAKGEKTTLLSEAAARRLQTVLVAPDGAAMGWFVAPRPWAGGLTLSHNVTNTNWFAWVWIAPERDLAVLAVTNQGGARAEAATDASIVALLRHAGAL